MNKKQHAKQLRKANDERREKLGLVGAMVYVPLDKLSLLERAVKRYGGEYASRKRVRFRG